MSLPTPTPRSNEQTPLFQKQALASSSRSSTIHDYSSATTTPTLNAETGSMAREPLLVVKDVSCPRPDGSGENIFENASFGVYEGDVLALRAKSGVGKTTLLKCLAHLNLYKGSIQFRGKTPMAHGVPNYRTHVQYVPQRPSLLPKTPRDFLDTLGTFKSRRKPSKTGGADVLVDYQRVRDVASYWGIEEELWDRAWNTLSGGESQRIALAIAFGLNTADILLLDEPTSALDATTSELVEKTLVNEVKNPEANLKAIIWITHSEEQAQRVATRTIQLTTTGVEEELIPDV